MIPIAPWFERSFRFDLEISYFPLVLERLLGTGLRLDHAVRSLSRALLTEKRGEEWSIQEHIGHLLDLEPLWLGRVEDILEGHEEMRPADLTNAKTHKAEHNARDASGIVSEFVRERRRLTDLLSGLSVAEVGRSALHPRLKQPMRIIDLALFVAEHDDHHLATVRFRLADRDR